jgi:hypothetical protein
MGFFPPQRVSYLTLTLFRRLLPAPGAAPRARWIVCALVQTTVFIASIANRMDPVKVGGVFPRSALGALARLFAGLLRLLPGRLARLLTLLPRVQAGLSTLLPRFLTGLLTLLLVALPALLRLALVVMVHVNLLNCRIQFECSSSKLSQILMVDACENQCCLPIYFLTKSTVLFSGLR